VVTFNMPKTNWSANGSGTLFKYKNTSAPLGPGPVKIAKLKSGLLKMVSKGILPVPVPNGPGTIDIALSLDGGTNTYCMTFSGTGDGNKFLVKDATAGSCLPPCPSGGQHVGGFCWYLGAGGQSCDAVCTGIGQTCDPATVTYAGSGGTDTNCQTVLNALGSAGALVYPSFDCAGVPLPGLGCATDTSSNTIRCATPTTTCSAAGDLLTLRACACQ
jgi:hypothetical protein